MREIEMDAKINVDQLDNLHSQKEAWRGYIITI